MEPGDRAAQDLKERTRVRLLAVLILLVGLAFIQDPGYLVADTKFDLAISPGHYLERALHLWDDQGAFGQVQNQAYGYLWPMGPFFVLFHLLDVPGWAVQRLWQGLVMCVAFLGTARVARTLGTRSDAACIVAGLAFALSPRMLTVLGPISIEAWPSALAPWVLLPLIRGSVAGSPRRAAGLSALGVAMVGGVNAAAAFAVLPLGVVWILTRSGGARRRSLMLWWPIFTMMGTLWWLIPLFLMGVYSPPFLDYIETTTVTTFPTTIFDALRGTSNWVPYVSVESRAGNDLLTTAYLCFNGGIVLIVSFAGLLNPRNPHRLFLSLSVVVGLLMVTAGHDGSVHGFFSDAIRGLLDGSLAPLRNVHKFDPIIRLPLVLGLAFVLDQILAARAAAPSHLGYLEQKLQRMNRSIVLGMILIGVVGATAPALVGRIEPANPVASVPGYWEEASDWLAQRGENSTALLAPGSTFGAYVWGSPKDEPLQFLARSPWAVRNTIPLSPTGNIRMLDGIEDRFAQGHGSAGLVSYLRRNGVGYLVVRNDLRPSNDIPDPVTVHQTLESSPGLRRVASFGPRVGGGAHVTTGRIRTVINGGWQTRYPAIEIYQVPDTAASTPGATPTTVVGGPEDLLELADLGVIGSEPVVLASDVTASQDLDPSGAAVVLTDGLRKRERFYARVHDAYSAVLTPGDTLRGLNPNPDYLEPGSGRWATTVRLQGARGISASSSGSDSDAPGGSRRGELPYAAVDGSTSSAWVSNPARGGRTWWRLTLDDATDVRRVTVTGGTQADENQALRVRTENGVSAEVTAGPAEAATVDLPPGSTSWIKVESPNENNRLMSLAELTFGGLDVQRQLILPRTPATWGNPGAVVLRADLDARRGCAVVDGSVRCAAGKDRESEEPAGAARRFTLASDGSYLPRLLVRSRAGAHLDALITRDQPINIVASSTGTPDPRSSPVAAIDGDPATTWVAEAGDFRPTLSLNWIGKRPISGISISNSDDSAARRPESVTLVWPGGRREVELDSRGRASFSKIRTSQLRIQVEEAEFAIDLGFDSRSSQIGVGIQELRLTGLPYLPALPSTIPAPSPCGSGPTVRVNGVDFPTSVAASPAALLSGKTMPATICSPGDTTSSKAMTRALDLRAGGNDVTVAGSATFDFVSLVLRDVDGSTQGTGTELEDAAPTSVSVSGGPVRKRLQPRPGDRVVNLGQNENKGWEARQDGRALQAVVLNGWQQGWILRSGDPVVATYGPDGLYRAGLGVGLLSFLALIALVVMMRRRSKVEAEPLTGASMPWLAAQVVVLGMAGLLAGWLGVLAAIAVSVLAVPLQRRLPDVSPWVLAGGCLLASVGYLVHPWADPSGWAGNERWPHYLVLIPVVASVLLAARARPRSLSLRLGASTRR